MKVVNFEGNERLGFVQINILEEALQRRASGLNVKKLQGEFKDIKKKKKAVLIITQDKEIELTYDILAGADGVYSLTREKLGIGCHDFGEAVAAVAAIDIANKEIEFGIHKYQVRCKGIWDGMHCCRNDTNSASSPCYRYIFSICRLYAKPVYE